MPQRPLKKYSKKDLVQLVLSYEENIAQLQETIDAHDISTQNIKYIILDAEKEDKKLVYIQKRMLCARRKENYVREYNRLMKQRQEAPVVSE